MAVPGGPKMRSDLPGTGHPCPDGGEARLTRMMLAKTAAQSRAVRPGDGMPSIAPAVSFTYKTLCLAHSVQMPFVHMSPCRLEHRTRHPGRALGSSPECELGQKKREKKKPTRSTRRRHSTHMVSFARDDRHRGHQSSARHVAHSGTGNPLVAALAPLGHDSWTHVSALLFEARPAIEINGFKHWCRSILRSVHSRPMRADSRSSSILLLGLLGQD